MSDHILHITEVTKYGTEYDLECVGHDKKTCNLQTWWFNEWDDLLKLDPIDIPIPVRAEWNNSDEPTIVLAAAEPAVTITWDGSDHAAKAINDALPDGAAASPAETSVYGHLGIKSAGDHPRYASIEADWRIRIEGDGFAILPPEVQS